ncbi:MAG: hypothetical protein CMP24_01525 [Rickettsiales bacterium]|nr:hypothetical protein [Rickettsiales bacterium]
MSILETIIFFLVIWWPVFFISLPFGFKPIQNSTNNNDNFARSAPAKPRILLKFLISTLISFFITIVIWMLSYFEVFSFKELII